MTETDKKNIYKELVNLLSMYCDTCMDKHQMEKILLCAFKLDLIEYATSEDIENVDALWESLARTLQIKLDGEPSVAKTNKCNCVNGVCALC